MTSAMSDPETSRELFIAGTSMGEAIPLGSRVRWDPVAPAEVAVGDVVVIRTDGPSLVHRVLAKAASRGGFVYVHRGDASPTAGIFRDDDLEGRVTGAEFKGEAREIPSGPSFGTRLYYALLLRLWIVASVLFGGGGKEPPKMLRRFWKRVR